MYHIQLGWFPDVTDCIHIRAAGSRCEQHYGAVRIGRNEGLYLGKMVAHCPDDSGLRVLYPGTVRLFPMAVCLADSYGDHQNLKEHWPGLILPSVISHSLQNWTE